MCRILSCIIEGIVGYGKMKQGARQCIEERKGIERPLLAREKTSLRSDDRFWFSNSVEVKKNDARLSRCDYSEDISFMLQAQMMFFYYK